MSSSADAASNSQKEIGLFSRIFNLVRGYISIASNRIDARGFEHLAK